MSAAAVDLCIEVSLFSKKVSFVDHDLGAWPSQLEKKLFICAVFD